MPLAAAPPLIVPEIDWAHDPLAVPFQRYMDSLDLYAWWRLQEASPDTSLDDASGNGRTATLASAANALYQQDDPITGEPGDHAMEFTGANSITGVAPDGSSLGHDLGLTGGLTLGLWVKAGANPASAKNIFGHPIGGGAPSVWVQPDRSLYYRRNIGGTVYFGTDSAAGSGVGSTYFVPLNEWVLIVLAVEGTATTSWTYLYAYDSAIGQMRLVGKAQDCTSDIGDGFKPIINRLTASPQFGGEAGSLANSLLEPVDEPFVIARPLSVAEVNRLFIARTANLFTTPTYEALPQVRKVSVGRGRQRQLERVEAGSSSWTADDVDADGEPARNLEPEYDGSDHYPNVVPMREGRLRAELAGVWREATSVLTASGNEISDLVRSLAVQGDGRAIENSVGIWEATTNLCTNGGFETNTTGWTNTSLTTMARSTTRSKFGGASLRCVGDAANDRAHFAATLASGTTYTFSAWLYLVSLTATAVILHVADNAGAGPGVFTSANFTTIGAWTRVTVTFTATSSTSHYFQIRQSGAGAAEWNADGVQMEAQPLATPYVETNGATATRNAARVQAPASWLDETQGWVAFRVRMPWASTAAPKGVNAFFEWADSTTTRLIGYFDSLGRVAVARQSAAVGSSIGSDVAFAAGDSLTILFGWNATQIKLSRNGGAFVSAANTNIPALAAALFDIGSAPQFADSQLDADILWAAFGTGALTDTDAAALHALTRDISPSDLGTAAGLTAIVPGDTATSALIPSAAADDLDLYTGYLERIPPDWISYKRTRLTLPFTDVLASLASWPVTGSYPQETTSARVTRILDQIGWRTERRVVDTGAETMIAATPSNENALSLLQLAADSEDGLLFVDESGRIVFHNRDHRTNAYRSRVPLYTFGDTPDELPYHRVVADYDGRRVINRVVVTWGAAATAVEEVDWTSIEAYGESAPFSITTALSTSAAATARAKRVLAANKDPKLRFQKLTLEPLRDQRLWPAVIGLGIGDRIHIIRRPYAGGAPLEGDFWIERVEHDIDGERRFGWKTTYVLSPAT